MVICRWVVFAAENSAAEWDWKYGTQNSFNIQATDGKACLGKAWPISFSMWDAMQQAAHGFISGRIQNKVSPVCFKVNHFMPPPQKILACSGEDPKVKSLALNWEPTIAKREVFSFFLFSWNFGGKARVEQDFDDHGVFFLQKLSGEPCKVVKFGNGRLYMCLFNNQRLWNLDPFFLV